MSLKTDTAYSTILQVLNLLFPIITAPYIARVLNVSDIGMINFVTSYTAYYVIFAGLNASFYGIREIAKNASSSYLRDKAFSEIFLLTVIASIICCCCYVLSIYTIDKLYTDKIFLLVSCLTLLLSPLNIDWYFIGVENVKYITIRSVIVRLASIIALFLFVRTSADTMNYLLISVIGTVGAYIWSFIYAIKTGLRIVLKELSLISRAKLMMPLFVSSIAISIYTILDTLMLGFLTSNDEVAYYNQAFKLSRILLSISIAASPIIVARINQYKGNKEFSKIRPLLIRSFEIILFLTLPMAVGLMVISTRFVPFFLGDNFLPSILPMQILSLLVIIIGVAYVYKVQILGAMEKDHISLYIAIFTAAMNFTTNLFLIPYLGAVGAAIASVLAEFISLVVGIIISRKIIRLALSVSEISKLLFAVILFFPISKVLSNIVDGDLIYLLATICFCAISYVVTLLLLNSKTALYVKSLVLNKIISTYN